MKLRNTTNIPDHALRRMTGWCARQIELPLRLVAEAKFGNRSDAYRTGRAYLAEMRIHVSVPRLSRGGGEELSVEARIEAAVGTTAHELFHLWAWANGKHTRRHGRGCGSSERQTKREERRVVAAFENDRDSLLAAWLEPPPGRRAKPRPTLRQKRAATAERNLKRWETKLKLAETKVAKYRKRVNYYRRQDASGPPVQKPTECGGIRSRPRGA